MRSVGSERELECCEREGERERERELEGKR